MDKQARTRKQAGEQAPAAHDKGPVVGKLVSRQANKQAGKYKQASGQAGKYKQASGQASKEKQAGTSKQVREHGRHIPRVQQAGNSV